MVVVLVMVVVMKVMTVYCYHLLSTHNKPSILHTLFPLTSSEYCKADLLIPTLQMSKLKLREMKWLSEVTQLTSGRANILIFKVSQRRSQHLIWHCASSPYPRT